jgi:aspartate/methionine/tyrosine aminotransferase
MHFLDGNDRPRRRGNHAAQKLACEHDLVVIADEIYERLAWNGRRHLGVARLPGMVQRTITLMGMTKCFSMGGWRIGFAFASSTLVAAMVKLQQHLMTCAGSFTQAGAALGLECGDIPEVRALWEQWEGRCRWMAEAVDKLPGLSASMPEGGFSIWADIRSTGMPSVEFADYLLRDYALAVIPGAAFGTMGEGYLRLTAVRSRPELERGIARLEKALEQLPSMA